jgi:hypothetical protein
MSTTQTIFRNASRHKPYAQIGNEMLRDERLSIAARGALAMILSYPTDWVFNMQWLCKKAGVGRDKAYSIISELKECGYCYRSQARHEDGTLGKIEYLFTDEPDAVTQEVGDIQPTASGFAVSGSAASGKTDTTKKENQKNKKSQRSFELKIDDATRRSAVVPRYVTERALDRVRELAPRWDRQALLRKFLDWPGSKTAENMDAAFLGWVKSFTKGKAPS